MIALTDMPPLPVPELPEEAWADRLLTWTGSALDGAVLQAMSLAVDRLLMPPPSELEEMRNSALAFVSGELWDEPRRFFSFLDTPAMPLRLRDRRRRRIGGGEIVALEIATRYRPYGQAAIDDAAWPDPILLEHWRHGGRHPRPTVVALHGFSMGFPRLDAVALFAAQCFHAGLDVVLLTLPFHGARTPPGARFSGERFAVPHIARLAGAVRQAIYEIHVVCGWLRRESAGPVGLLGLSLGGYLSSLLAGLTADLDFVIPMVPPVCMGDLAWRFFARSRHYRTNPQPAFSHEELRAAFRVHSPLTFAPRLERDRILILAGRGDRIVPPEHPYALWRHWGEPEIYWFSGSHLAPFRRGQLISRVLAHIERVAGKG